MSDMHTMVRTEVIVNGSSSLLAQGQDLDDLRRQMEAAMATTGRFVTFTVVGNREVSVLISPHSQVALTVATVQFDPRDTGDQDEPYGGLYDF